MKKISEAVQQSKVKTYLKCQDCGETFLNDLLSVNLIKCPNGCDSILHTTSEEKIITEDKEKIKQLEEELDKVYEERNDLIDLSQAYRCKSCKRFGILRGYVCFFCRADPTTKGNEPEDE